MTKKEFLEQLRLGLAREVPTEEIKSQLNYYDQYITEQSKYKNEEQVIEEIGAPNIIAKTIIDAYERNYGSYNQGDKGYYNDQWDSSGYKSSSKNSRKDYDDPTTFNNKYYKNNNTTPWYVKVVRLVILILIVILIIFLTRLFFSILIYLLPIILIILLVIIINVFKNP